MMDREGAQHMSEGKPVDRSQWPPQAQECSMCGHVGFADQLHRCTLCRFRHQHTYCCTSTEGLRTGTWMCDWCRLLKKEKSKDGKEIQAVGVACSVLSEESGGLECLLKAALNEAQQAGRIQTSSGDGGSFCSSSIESVKENEMNPGAIETRSCSSDDRISLGEETMSAFPGVVIPRGSTGDSKRNPKLGRCGIKSTQKRRPKSVLEQQGSVQLKRLSSMKSSKPGVACDPPKSFIVRRYKSLSDISF